MLHECGGYAKRLGPKTQHLIPIINCVVLTSFGYETNDGRKKFCMLPKNEFGVIDLVWFQN